MSDNYKTAVLIVPQIIELEFYCVALTAWLSWL